MPSSAKRAVVGTSCVACAGCVSVCPFGALLVYRGTRAVVNNKKCVGCGKCAVTCPAGIIQIVKGEVPAL